MRLAGMQPIDAVEGGDVAIRLPNRGMAGMEKAGYACSLIPHSFILLSKVL
jgi:hypothetical protein